MQVGEEWIYRLRESAPSERVRILGIQPKKTSARVDVEFVADGRRENVPGSRLRRLWAEVDAYDALMAKWARIEFELTDAEDGAASEVFDNLIPAAVATCEWSPVRHATAVHDRSTLERLLDADLDAVLDGVPSFDLDGIMMVSPEGTLRIAEVMCARRPADVLAWVLAEEAEIRASASAAAPPETCRGTREPLQLSASTSGT